MAKLLIDQMIEKLLHKKGLTNVAGSTVVPRITAGVVGRATMSLTPSNTYSFDEKNTDDVDAKIAFNKVLNNLDYLEAIEWKKVIENLNENAADKTAKMSSKDCYRIGLIKFIKHYSEALHIQFAKYKEERYVYTSKYWAKLDNDLLNTFLRNAALRLGIVEAVSRDSGFLKKAFNQYISECFFEIERTTDVSYLNLSNGILKITSDGIELIPHDAKLFQSYLLDYDYDPENTNEEWLDFIDEVVPDKDTQKTLQQSLAYLFVRDIKLEKAFILYGNGANGKSVVFEVIKGLIPEQMITHNTLTDLCTKNSTNTYFKYELMDKLINYASDITLKGIEASVFKALVSGEPMQVRKMGEQPVLMKNYAKLIFNANRLDDASIENTDGFFRRFIIIPFEITIAKEKRDKNLHKKLLKNRSGIINWILEGLTEVRLNEEIFESQKCIDTMEQFKVDASPVRTFLEENKIIKTDPTDNIVMSLADIFDMYKDFCEDQKEKPMERRLFSAELKRLGFDSRKRNTGLIFYAKIDKNDDIDSEKMSRIIDIISK